jgi:hypothetical protein
VTENGRADSARGDPEPKTDEQTARATIRERGRASGQRARRSRIRDHGEDEGRGKKEETLL